ncbi:MAG TPA: hypothetical protein VIW68_05085 [Candidatus Sulfotelmatobacter sp.]
MASRKFRQHTWWKVLKSSSLAITTFLLLLNCAHADNAAFDLPGPRIDVKVTRSGKTLPISEVPNLQAGDRLWLHPEIPVGQSTHYLLIAAFLRGSTYPPPDQWFTKALTWTKQVKQEGITVTVPENTEQALIFLAPETGGDFPTLRSAVRGRPGAFVRASQDLNQAALDRSRLDKYLASIREAADADSATLHERSLMLSRSLKIKLDNQCFDKPTQEQAPCLLQNTDQLILDDGHSQSMVAALTSGPATDLAGTISATRIAGGGAYSPYVGAVIDLAHMMEGFRTAQYQYIPALALPKREELDLKLNNPASFRKPMSVIVVALPAVEAAQMPPLRALEPKHVSCLQQSALVLSVDGAPLVFSTAYAHDMVLHVENKTGLSVDLPATADAAHGGFMIDTRSLHAGDAEGNVVGTLRGYWGFEPVTGPAFPLQFSHSAQWTLATADSTALIVGREDSFHLQSEKAPCVDQITIKDDHGKLLKATWKLSNPDQLEVKLPLQGEPSGPVVVLLAQSGLTKPDQVSLQTYSEAPHLDHFVLDAGDPGGILTGTRLDQVAGLELAGIHFAPASLSRINGKDELRLAASSAKLALKPDETLVAHVALKDGRVLDLDTTIAPPRPRVTLLSKSPRPGLTPSVIRLGNQEDLPQDGEISFFLNTEIPATFRRDEKIEVETEDGSSHALFGFADGTLFLEDPQTVLINLQPLKSFGPSVFGPLRFRPVSGDGEKGDWQPLVKLVRVPTLKEVRCPDSPDKPCTLIGENLFLLDSVGSDPQFVHNVPVSSSFVESGLTVPRPNGTLLYIKLRDDPSVVNKAALPVLPDSPGN